MSEPTPRHMDAALHDELKSLYPIDSRPLYFAGGHAWSDGTIYQYTSGGTEYLIKVMPSTGPELLAAVQERQRWMEYLAKHGVGTLSPLHTSKGSLAESFANGSMLCYSWKKSSGRHIQPTDPRERQDFYPQWGALVGKMHRLAQDFPFWEHSDCVDAAGVPLISRAREVEHFRGWIQDDEVREAWLELNERLERLPKNRQNYGFVHNDAHPGNILFEDERLVLIDFDVANYQWFILDLCICFFSEFAHVEHHSPHKDLLPRMDELFIKPFMRGYSSENTLPEQEFAHVEDFIRYRRFIMYAAFYDQIKDAAPQYLRQMKQELISGESFFKDGRDFLDRLR